MNLIFVLFLKTYYFHLLFLVKGKMEDHLKLHLPSIMKYFYKIKVSLHFFGNLGMHI